MNGSTKDMLQPWLLASPITEFVPQIANSSNPCNQLLKVINAFRTQRSMTALPTTAATDLSSSALVHVKVEMLGRGSPDDMAMIYKLRVEERGDWLRAYELEKSLGRAGHAEMHAEISEVQRVSSITVD